MSVKFDMSEVRDLSRTLDRAGIPAEAASHLHVKTTAARLAADARGSVAVRSGDTYRSIRVEDEGDDATVIADSDAAFYLEFGTSDTAPQPFMWPHAPAAARRLAEAMENIDPFT